MRDILARVMTSLFARPYCPPISVSQSARSFFGGKLHGQLLLLNETTGSLEKARANRRRTREKLRDRAQKRDEIILKSSGRKSRTEHENRD